MASTPLVALVTGPTEAAGILLPVLVAQDCVALWMFRSVWDRQFIGTMVPGAALGIFMAYLFAANVPEGAVAFVLGVISVMFAAQRLWLDRMPAAVKSTALPNTFWGCVSGIGSGFTSAIAHAGTPPFQFYVLPQRLEKTTYIGTSVVFFASVNAMKIPAFAALGQFGQERLLTAAALLPIALLSSWLGARLVRLINPQRFALAVNLTLAGIGVTLIIRGWNN